MVSERVVKYLDLLAGEKYDAPELRRRSDPDLQAAVQYRYAHFAKLLEGKCEQNTVNYAVFGMRQLTQNMEIPPTTKVFEHVCENLWVAKQYSALDYLCRSFSDVPSLTSIAQRPWYDYHHYQSTNSLS